jgi:hypothetical protein
MRIRNIIKEELDDFDWVRDVKPGIHSIDDISNNLNIPFSLFSRETGKLENEYSIKDSVYWLDHHPKSPKRYNVCWYDKGGEKNCVDYSSSEIVNNFDEGYWDSVWLWKFVDKIIGESTDDFDWIRDVKPETENFFIPGQTYYMYRTSDPSSTKPYVFIKYGKKHSFWDRSLLVFDEGSYTAEYLERQLDFKGLTLFDLLPDNNLNESQDDFDWIKNISDEWEPKVGDKFICKPGFRGDIFSGDIVSNNYGGAGYVEGRVYTIESISNGKYDLILFTVENENGVYKAAAEPYF